MSVMRFLIAGCFFLLVSACGETALPRVIGAAPLEGSHTNVGSIQVWVTGKDELGGPLLPDPEGLAFGCELASCEAGEHRTIEGFSEGVYVLLVDGSGSNEAATPDICQGCPTDPHRKRVEATKVFIRTMARFAPEWTGAIMQFGPSQSDGFEITDNLSGYTSDAQRLSSSAERLSSEGGTYLWDSLDEVLDSLDAQVKQRFPGREQKVGRQLIVISDGEDTRSSHSLEEVVAKAVAMGVRIHTVGFSSVPPESCALAMPELAVKDLREVSLRTNGVSSITSADELPRLFGNLARASLVGAIHQTLRVQGAPDNAYALVGQVKADEVEEQEPFAVELPLIH